MWAPSGRNGDPPTEPGGGGRPRRRSLRHRELRAGTVCGVASSILAAPNLGDPAAPAHADPRPRAVAGRMPHRPPVAASSRRAQRGQEQMFRRPDPGGSARNSASWRSVTGGFPPAVVVSPPWVWSMRTRAGEGLVVGPDRGPSKELPASPVTKTSCLPVSPQRNRTDSPSANCSGKHPHPTISDRWIRFEALASTARTRAEGPLRLLSPGGRPVPYSCRARTRAGTRSEAYRNRRLVDRQSARPSGSACHSPPSVPRPAVAPPGRLAKRCPDHHLVLPRRASRYELILRATPCSSSQRRAGLSRAMLAGGARCGRLVTAVARSSASAPPPR